MVSHTHSCYGGGRRVEYQYDLADVPRGLGLGSRRSKGSHPTKQRADSGQASRTGTSGSGQAFRTAKRASSLGKVQRTNC